MGRVCWTKIERKSSRNCIRNFSDPLAAAAVTAALLWLAFFLGAFVPFGNNTPAVTDAKLQYLDLFAYCRDVLTGQNSAGYTFSNTLGGSAIAIWAYYLASPLNFLVLLFPKEQMNLFLEVLITAKLSAASAAFALFIGWRFRGRIRREIALVLSVSYGLMQYTLAQGSNVMWLDGVILLPFIVLGVHKIVRASEGPMPEQVSAAAQSAQPATESAGRTAVLFLAVPAALSVIANWYTGGINYLFSAAWLVYEAARRKRGKMSAQTLPGVLGRYLAGMGLGLLLASFLFVPNVLALRLGKGAAWNPAAVLGPAGAWDSGAVMDTAGAVGFMSGGLRGNPLSVFRSYRIGEISDSSKASFFCGSLALFGTAGYFLSRRIAKREKAAGAGLLLFAVMSVFWQPLFVLFSLFQYSNSYWYRYGYLGSFVLLYLAAYWAGSLHVKGAGLRRQESVILMAGIISILAVIISQRVWPSGGSKSTRIMIFVLAGITALLLVSCAVSAEQGSGNGAPAGKGKDVTAAQRKRSAAGKAAAIALAVLCVGEMFLETRAMLGIYHTDTAEEYASYSRQEQEQIGALLSFDTEGFYRVNQTSTRIGNKDGLTAAYLDAMAYGYASVSGYTSCPENIQLEFLDRLGYRKEYDSFNIVNTSFLPADSLLGVRYVLSPYEIPGLRIVEELGAHNRKAVYVNPFALPVAMVYDESGKPAEAEDPFAELEQIYGMLAGQESSLFAAVPADKEYETGKTAWTLTVPEGNYCLYGNLPWKEPLEGRLMVGEDWGYGYGGWLSPSVFYIPVPVTDDAGGENGPGTGTDASGKRGTVRVTLETQGEPELSDEQFYALDLDRLSEASGQIKARSAAVRDLDIQGGKISCTVNAGEGQSLILSVPASKGWTAKVNGQKTEIGSFEGCFMQIPLVQGENHITMQYRVPGMAAGAVMTLTGAAVCVVMMLAGSHRRS